MQSSHIDNMQRLYVEPKSNINMLLSIYSMPIRDSNISSSAHMQKKLQYNVSFSCGEVCQPGPLYPA